MRQILHTARITRPRIALQAALSSVLGSYLSGTHVTIFSTNVMIAALVTGLVCAFGFVINDYHDAAADSISKPHRSIPAGIVSRRAALGLAIFLATVAFFLACILGFWSATAALFLIGLSAAYSLFSLKTEVLLGIGTVAFLTSATVGYGSLAAGGLSSANVIFMALLFLNQCSLETLYTLEDMPGDARAAVATTAVRLGPLATLWLFQVFTLAFLLSCIVPWLLGLTSNSYIVAMLVCTILPTTLVLAFVRVTYDDSNVHHARLALRVIRILSIIPVLLLR